MKLNELPFENIKSGKKIIEIRLFDEKRKLLNLGDIIQFSLSDSNQYLRVEVKGLLRYPTFKELVDDFPMSNFGYPINYSKEEFVNSIYSIYSKENEQKYGVLGIRLKLV